MIANAYVCSCVHHADKIIFLRAWRAGASVFKCLPVNSYSRGRHGEKLQGVQHVGISYMILRGLYGVASVYTACVSWIYNAIKKIVWCYWSYTRMYSLWYRCICRWGIMWRFMGIARASNVSSMRWLTDDAIKKLYGVMRVRKTRREICGFRSDLYHSGFCKIWSL
jgi:hypothetical protein